MSEARVRATVEQARRVVALGKPIKATLVFPLPDITLNEHAICILLRWIHVRSAFEAQVAVMHNGVQIGELVLPDELYQHLHRGIRDRVGVDYVTGIMSETQRQRQLTLAALFAPTQVPVDRTGRAHYRPAPSFLTLL